MLISCLHVEEPGALPRGRAIGADAEEREGCSELGQALNLDRAVARKPVAQQGVLTRVAGIGAGLDRLVVEEIDLAGKLKVLALLDGEAQALAKEARYKRARLGKRDVEVVKIDFCLDGVAATLGEEDLSGDLHRAGRAAVLGGQLVELGDEADATDLHAEAAQEVEFDRARQLDHEFHVFGDHAHVAGERAIDKLNLDLGQPRQRSRLVVAGQGRVASSAAEREIKVIGAAVFHELEADAVQREVESAAMALQEVRSRQFGRAANQAHTTGIRAGRDLRELKGDISDGVADERRGAGGRSRRS